MEVLDALRTAWELLGGGGREEPWAVDEQAFAEHFGIDYEVFANALARLDLAHRDMYEKTMRVNPEAAVTWAIFVAT